MRCCVTEEVQEVQLIERLGLRQRHIRMRPQEQYRWLNKKYDGDVYHVDDVRQVCIRYRIAHAAERSLSRPY